MTHRFRTTPRARITAALALAVLSLTACGGGDDEPEAGATSASAEETTSSEAPSSSPAARPTAAPPPVATVQTLTATEADFSISLDSDALTAGTYRVEVVNQGAMAHALDVERDGEDVAESDSVDPGGSTTFEVTLEPGRYVFYCPIGGHRAAGMEITVQVT
ncbi:hypothetical protein E4P40_14840 [Blastococcus sp. CT_GayMR20]|uniref:cupredoxin domain-containing protein n=1 Tax=Blastococcus sp. CT_GayMR20 TaxID=2559609 RepID=UPI0010734144|nr:plastocyanin/azurin family copper-binding protein [Blastococcus sp. CT_GayMR20]TFV83031.1 hypothetical protein E4P40_14840 [Blastococcus sp. CT_GayMR20]